MSINKIDRVVLHDSVKQEIDNKATKQELQNVKAELENTMNEIYQGIVWKPTVPTFDDLRTHYPDAKDGWTANVGDTNITYQYDEETDTWFPTSINALPLATSEIDGLMSQEDKAKLDTIEYNAQKNLTAEEMLDEIKTVDGEGSGLDADLLQGKDKDYFARADHNHDGVYYKQEEVNILLGGKANKIHKHSPDDIKTNTNNRFVSDKEKEAWNNKWDYNEDTIKNIKVNKAKDADTVNGKVVNANVPTDAKFTDTITTINGKTGVITKDDIVALGIPAQDTTYSEISKAEIDIGTSSTKRVITGRRVKYILDKVRDWINSLTKADIGLGNVDNVKQATKVEFDTHNNDSTRHITSDERNKWNNKANKSDIPTKVSQLENDKEYITSTDLGNAGYGDMMKCYNVDTDILTDRGFINITQLNKQDKVATLNPSNNEIVYQPVKNIYKYNNVDKLYEISNQQIDLSVTLNHKMYVKKRGKDSFELVEAKDIIGKRVEYKKDGIWKGDYKPYVDIEDVKIPIEIYAEFMGYYLSEGCTINAVNGQGAKDYLICITQVKPKTKERIFKVTKQVAFLFNRNAFVNNSKNIKISDKRLYNHLYPFGKSYEKYIPDIIMNSTQEIIRIFLKAYVDGDGNRNNDCNRKTEQWSIFTTSKKMADQLQELALKAGWSANISKNNKIGDISYINGRKVISKHTCYRVGFNKMKNTPMVNHGHVKKQNAQSEGIVKYGGSVIGVEVAKYHTLYVRRNGKAVWSGNSTYDKNGDGIVDDSERLNGKTLNEIKDELNEPKTVSTSSYSDIISLPSSATNGQVSVGVEGETRTNLFDFDKKVYGRNATKITNSEFNLKGSFSNSTTYFDFNLPINTLYTLIIMKSDNTIETKHSIYNYNAGVAKDTDILKPYTTDTKITFTPTKDTTRVFFRIEGDIEQDINFKVMLLEGDYTDKKVGYITTGTKSTVGSMRVKSVGKNLFDKRKSLKGVKVNPTTGDFEYGDTPRFTSDLIPIDKNKKYIISGLLGKGYSFVAYYDNDGNFTRRTDGKSRHIVNVFTQQSNEKYIRVNAYDNINSAATWADIDEIINNLQLEKGDTPTEYEPYKESRAYIVAKKDGKIVNLRSLPNGVKDEINVSGRRVIKRTKKIIFDGSENWKEFVTAYADTDGFYRMQIDGWVTQNKAVVGYDTGQGWNDLATFRICTSISTGASPNSIAFHPNGNLHLSLPRDYIDANYSPSLNGMRQYLADHPITLIYQLAEPEIIPIRFTGLQSYENGTVYFDTVIPELGFYYNNGLETHSPEHPIKEVDTLYKVDKETGLRTPLDTSKCEIRSDRLSFSHPDLQDGDLCDWDYIPMTESTQGKKTIVAPTNISAAVDGLLKDSQIQKENIRQIGSRIDSLLRSFNDRNEIRLGKYKLVYNDTTNSLDIEVVV